MFLKLKRPSVVNGFLRDIPKAVTSVAPVSSCVEKAS